MQLINSSPENMRLAHYRGGIALIGHALRDAAHYFDRLQGQNSPSHPLHITLLTSIEYKLIGKPSLNDISEAISLDHVYALGCGPSRSNQTQWIVVVWNHADVWRKSHGLGKQQYHITLSEANDHDIDKGINSLLGRSGINDDRFIQSVGALGFNAMDHVVVACADDSPYLAEKLAKKMISVNPTSYKGYARLGEHTCDLKTSLLGYARAVALNPALLDLVVSRILKLTDTVSWGPVTTSTECDTFHNGISDHLLRIFPAQLNEALSSTFWSSPTESRHRAITPSGYELPRFFSWIYPGRLAGMSTPRTENDIDALIDLGFTQILSLTAEEALPDIWFRLKPVEHVFIPVDNYGAPTIQEMDVIFTRFMEGGNWLVHCGGGVGRAGTVLACLTAMLGKGHHRHSLDDSEDGTPRLDAKEAIRLIRHARPRSLESERQEGFVAEWISHRWKMAHTSQIAISEPVTTAQSQFKPGFTENDLHRSGSLSIMLIGKPGSGKSWFSAAISKRRPRYKTIIVSQDESRSREGCERTFGQKHGDDTLVILDRCNPTADDRKYWVSLSLASTMVAIYFDYPVDLCQRRVDARIDHPRIRAGRGANALRQMDRDMKQPTITEGFSAIYTISSFSAAREVVYRLTGDPPLLKFPRTPHLLDLGAPTSDDIVKPAFETLKGNLTIEEKIDGANMGFSLDWDGAIRCQNRSHWVSSSDHAQFKPLDRWFERHSTALRKILDKDQHFPERYILYGEWMVAKHSVHYNSLPDQFIAYDLYDRLQNTFLSRQRLEMALRGSGINQVPLIAQVQSVKQSEALDMIQRKSAFGAARVEGVYIRFENESRSLTIDRGKVVRGDFIAGNEHWSKGKITLNGVVNVFENG